MTDTERIVKALRECTCHESYTKRRMEDPTCQFHSGLGAEAADEIERIVGINQELAAELLAWMAVGKRLAALVQVYQTISPN
jgi:hypothetical protein